MPHLHEDIRRFLVDLKANNDRDWFAGNRDRFEQARAGFISFGGIRLRIDRNAAALHDILDAPAFRAYFGGIAGESLKTAPKGWSRDHPEIALLRQKSFLARHRLTDEQVFSPEFLSHATTVYRALKPLDDFLNAAVEFS